MKIVLKGVPPSLNRFAGRLNNWEYRNAKKQWTDAVQWACRAEKARETPEKALVRIDYFFPDKRRHEDVYKRQQYRIILYIFLLVICFVLNFRRFGCW